MAQENEDGQEKSEDPTEERREEFRKKGDIAISREFTSVFILAASITFIAFIGPKLFDQLKKILTYQFELMQTARLTQDNFIAYSSHLWMSFLKIIIPIFLLTTVIAVSTTFLQTRLSFSWKRLEPNFQKFNILKGLARMVSSQSLMELAKGISKMIAVCAIAYLILISEWTKVPSLLNLSIIDAWSYWLDITKSLFWAVSAFLVLVAASDYIYNFVSLENKMKMTKKEVKDEYKKREVDPMIKGRMRRMAREILSRKMVSDTKNATVLITNPTHYSIAIKYELGMEAPIVIAKGIDFLALKMREVAKSEDIPIVENRPLARTLYKTTEIGDHIPETLYKAISEVIRYVFKLKGIRVNQKSQAQPA
ncbi:MAG: flagellar biosynthesis protein FlhB [Bdellovibrionota bacterium]